MIFLMVAFLVLSLVFLLAGLLVNGTVAARNERLIMAGIACGAALASLLGYLIMLWIRHVYSNRKASSRRSVSNSGSAMLMVLVLVGTAAALLLRMQTTAGSRLRTADSAFSMLRLRLAAGDVAEQLIQRLADDEDLLRDYPQEDWAQPFELEFPDGVVASGRVLDAQRRFDLNNLAATRPANASERSAQALREIMRECAVPAASDMLVALADWVDADADGRYESQYYGEQDQPYESPDGIMLGEGEMDWIAAWSNEIYRRIHMDGRPALRDLATVLPSERSEPFAVNVNTAPPELLNALLGAGRTQIVDLLVSMRDDLPLGSLAVLETLMGADELDRLRPFLDVKSSFFDIHVVAEQGGRAVELTALVERSSDGTVSVLRWSI